MSREELALETQLLLQEVTQITQNEAVESVLEDANAPQPVSELETAKQALLEKLKRKKEANRAQRHQLNQQRYGQVPGKKNDIFSPRKNKQQSLKLPVASTASGGSRKKQNMLTKLKTQAIQQGAQNMAKLFGYSSYEEQLKHLNQIEKKKILQNEMKEKLEKAAGEEVEVDDNEDVEMQEGDVGETEAVEQDGSGDADRGSHVSTEPESEKLLEQVLTAPKDSHNDVSVQVAPPVNKTAESAGEKDEHEDQDSVVVVKRRNMIRKQDVVEQDGNEADSEQDDKEGDDEDADVDVAMDTAAGVAVDTNEQDAAMEEGEGSSKPEKSTTPKDKAAGYRNLLRAEALQNRRRKRLVKGRGDNFVESEAEEDEEEDVLKIGGLGDFGFGVPQATTQESKEAEEERNALKLRKDDLDHIVDDISDDERAQEQDLDEMFRREQEDQDRQQVKEVMRNVKEGFGRNRRAFSGLHSGSEARGRFNLDELVAADGSKFEAARLGLLESDEELSEGEDGSGEKKNVNANGEEEEGKELDEEAEMERMLRERFMNQPKIYVTSSESGSDNEDENDAAKEKTGADNDEIESDEERERQQMKLFSERARVNRRMQRMKDLQRQIALENNEADPNAKAKTIPNVLLEEDEDSQELMHLLNRTDVDAAPTNTANGPSHTKARPDRPRPKLGRFNSYGGITSSSRGSSSFSRVIGQCKMFSANANSSGGGSSKGFVFTSFSADKPEQDGDENAAPNNDESVPTARPDFAKSKSWSGAGSKASTKRRGAPGGRAAASSKKRKSGGLFSVLSSYQCVSSTSQSQSQE